MELDIQKIVAIIHSAMMKKVTKFFGDFYLLPLLFEYIKNWPTFLLDHFKLKRGNYGIQLRNGLLIEVRSGTTDKGAMVEVFLLEVYKVAMPFITSAKLIIDIGAQIGNFSLYAHKLNPKANILSFEPCAANFGMLKKNIEINRITNVKPYQRAVVSETKEVKLFLFEKATGSHSLYRPSPKAEMVQGLGINELFDSLRVTQCDLIKMDCEGAEVEIIRNISSAHLMATRAIIMEYHNPASVPEMEAKLLKHDFEVDTRFFPILFAYRQ